MNPAEQTMSLNDPARPALAAVEEWIEERQFRVILNLADGESVEVATFEDEPSADAHAKAIASQLATTGEWPSVRGRYLRPETIVSVEISERRLLTGSPQRAQWGQSLNG